MTAISRDRDDKAHDIVRAVSVGLFLCLIALVLFTAGSTLIQRELTKISSINNRQDNIVQLEQRFVDGQTDINDRLMLIGAAPGDPLMISDPDLARGKLDTQGNVIKSQAEINGVSVSLAPIVETPYTTMLSAYNASLTISGEPIEVLITLMDERNSNIQVTRISLRSTANAQTQPQLSATLVLQKIGAASRAPEESPGENDE